MLTCVLAHGFFHQHIVQHLFIVVARTVLTCVFAHGLFHQHSVQHLFIVAGLALSRLGDIVIIVIIGFSGETAKASGLGSSLWILFGLFLGFSFSGETAKASHSGPKISLLGLFSLRGLVIGIVGLVFSSETSKGRLNGSVIQVH